ncbi:CcdC protein domain-containing protein [Streptomyces sp. TLI_146]|uniref:CcdC protein domain-containing protein n=1 Tax=Streptomyces sp. TLI_146 TaxID=1938858 RepID=UPI000C7065F9|nr:CcdC protein domain-containing protein [Streptomyces sp. TLI_146]PKV88425.1 uncharacterized protein DUF1453 [Streptomyces sp. TLI_146]
MSALVNVLVAVAVVALIVSRQVRPQQLADAKRWWLVPAVLVYLAIREKGLVDPDHHLASVLLLGTEVATGLLMGAAWGWTSKLWTEADGSVWTKGTRATAAVWAVGIAVRAGLAGIGALAGIRMGTGALLLGLAASLLVRSGILVWRTQSLPASYGVAGDSPARPLWKDRV